jgi:penicillin amidase
MARSWRAIALAVLGAGLLAFLAVREIGARRALQRTLPSVDGRLDVRGLDAEVAILRDDHGVPHVLARSEGDAWFGLGFAQAQDRLAQLAYLVRAARGCTAEVLGEDGLAVDRWSRTLGFGRLADAQLARLDAPTRRALEAWAAGINAWIEEVRSGRAPAPLPLFHLGVAPEPWQPADAIAVSKLVAWGLDGSVDATLVLWDLIERLGGFGARPFFPRETATELAPPAPDFEARRAIPRDPLRAALGLEGRSIGSSAWLVGSGASASGAPILAGDLHLAPTAPSLLYQAHLAAPGLDAAGVGIVGVPGFWSGHNDRVAWAATHARAVATDLYVETISGDRYGAGNGTRPLAHREERIAVRGAGDVVLRVRETHHGPLLDGLLPGERPSLAVAWGGAQAGDGVGALVRALRAGDAAAFRDALAEHHEPVLSIVYADARGGGGRQVAGWLPARNMPTGLVPVPGRSPWYDWLGRVPYAALPQAPLASDGFTIAADAGVPGGAGIEWWWRSGERALRIESLLREARSRGPIEAGAVATILADQRSANAPARARALLDLAGPVEAMAPEARTVARLLSSWDGSTGSDSVGAAVWHVLLVALLESSLEQPLGAELLARHLSLRGVGLEALLDRLLEAALAPADEAGEVLVPLDALRQGVQAGMRRTGLQLRARLGSDPDRWGWGLVHPLRFAAFGWSEAAWGLGQTSSWPAGGDGVTIAAGEYDPNAPFDVRVASVHRWVVDLAAPEIALATLVPGATEHAGEMVRSEAVERWLDGRPGVLATHRFLIEDGARARLELVPQAAEAAP